ncbi:aryl-sulfate sulfotransferase [Pseudodesulfovibrio tunisiensis]|uniref:aryl-sulfate sulfotransferase n=1 Tax=Pseudodesulfovibrio tunisiensis TaxID=463192 RepID=UPI001FB1ACAC|nr:aryl-sulfate sulfotransferase [Pseudodesulfovibrio tunisiensis]
MHTFSRYHYSALAALLLLMFAVPVHAYEALVGPTGVLKYDRDAAFEGYTLFDPGMGTTTYLIDMEGNVVHTWSHENKAGAHSQLLPNGHLLRASHLDKPATVGFGGEGGLLQEFDWDGNLVWQYRNFSDTSLQHHSFRRLANGNTLVLCWERKTNKEAIAKGRDPKAMPEGGLKLWDMTFKYTWVDYIQEVDRNGKVVWEWHVWDHIGTGPDEIDINWSLKGDRDVVELMDVIDWTHCNSVDVTPDNKHVILNSRNFGEFYVIDRKTGDIVYRWGNPSTHAAGKAPTFIDNGDQELFGAHHVSALENGHFLIFDNGWKAPEGNRSRAVEMDPKTGRIVWQYKSRLSNSFYSMYQGGAQRLPNGNTFITSTGQGHLIEVTGGKTPKVVWEFVNPIFGDEAHCLFDEGKQYASKSAMTPYDIANNYIHRAYRYGKDYPAFKGRNLTPGAYVCGDDCPRFYKTYKAGAVLTGGQAADEEDWEEEDGPTMHAY